MNAVTLERIKYFARKEYSQSEDVQHGFDHIERVTNNARLIIKTLKLGDKLDEDLLVAACYLHDVIMARKSSKSQFVVLFNHIFERSLNSKHIWQILDNFDLTSKEKQILGTSIIYHNHSLPYRRLNRHRDIYSKVLQDADSRLPFFK